MNIDLKSLLPTLFVVAGVIYGYGQLSSKVDRLNPLIQLADDNMNNIIELKLKMNLLVTPQMEIVGSKKVQFNKIRIDGIEKDLYK
tara:strand:- start:6707 stop:6964 length:258 start_codon:yes stop_codon:yes gene_type:complete